MLATTATANARVVADVAEQLGAGEAATCSPSAARSAASPCGSACCRLPDCAAAARLAARPPRRPARQRHHLHPHRLGRRGHRRAPARGGSRGRRLHRPDRPGRPASAPRTPLRDNEVKALVATSRARAWASTSPTSASSCTSARRRRRSPTTSRSAAPGRGDRAAPTSCCCPGRRTATSGTTSPPRRCRREEQAAAVLAALAEAGRPLSTVGARGPGRPAPHAAGAAAEGARRRRRRATGQRRLGVDRPAVDVRRRALRPDRRRPVDEQDSMLDYERPRRLPDGVPPAALDDETAGAVRPLRQLRRPLVPRRDRLRRHGAAGQTPEPRRGRPSSRGCSGPAGWTGSACR